MWLAPYFEDRLSRAIEWWFSNFSTPQDPSEGLLKHSLLAPPQSFWFSRSGTGPKNLHCFKEALFFSCSHCSLRQQEHSFSSGAQGKELALDIVILQDGIDANALDSGRRDVNSGFKSQFCHLVVRWPWADYSVLWFSVSSSIKWGHTLDLFIFINLFIYFLAALGLCCCTRAFSSCGEWGLLFVAVCGLLIVVASLVVETGL